MTREDEPYPRCKGCSDCAMGGSGIGCKPGNYDDSIEGILVKHQDRSPGYTHHGLDECVTPCSRCGRYGAHYCTGTGAPRGYVWADHGFSAEEVQTCLLSRPEYTDYIDELNQVLRELEAPVCKKHKRYKAKRAPSIACEGCWRRYIHFHPTT